MRAGLLFNHKQYRRYTTTWWEKFLKLIGIEEEK